MEEQSYELIKKYRETGDVSYRNRFAEKYLYIAEILAKKFVGRGVPYDDLYQEASLSLLRGIERFDPEKGVQFSTFITPTITGELKNYFRDKMRMIKPPRRMSEIHIAAKKFSEKQLAATGEKPTIGEIARALKVEEEEVVRAMEIGATLSLDGMTESESDDGLSLHEKLPAENVGFEEFETRETLFAAMKNFSEAEKKLIAYRFSEGLSQMETAKRLGVSQMFVSRTERKVLQKLKEELSEKI
ncbi:MAG: sigma-70 family RNA polymerase sigma factor [Clostridia bacterium]|nr:sigma-70 family RNA polymerase sigma factor [Clostridia bacterium]